MVVRQKITTAPYAVHSLAQSSLAAEDGDPAQALTIDSDGYVGIGTATPNSKLTVAGDLRTDSLKIQPDGAGVAMTILRDETPGEEAFELRAQGSGYTAYRLQLGRSDAANNVHIPARLGIGTRDPEVDLHVRAGPGSGQTPDHVVGMFLENYGVSNSSYVFQAATAGAGKCFSITNAGRVGIGTTSPDYLLEVTGAICGTSYCEPSDARLKTNIQTVEDGLASLLNLRPVRFDWRKDSGMQGLSQSGRQIGFIAQEVDEVVPEIVNLGADGYYALDYGKLTPVLVAAVKELNGIVQARDDELARLNEENVEMKQRLAELEATVKQLIEAQAAKHAAHH